MPSPKRERQRASQQARRAAEINARKRAGQKKRAVAILVVVAVILLFTQVFSKGGSKKAKTKATPTTSSASSTTNTTTAAAAPACPKADGSSLPTKKFAAPPPMCIDAAKTYTAEMKTDKGTMVIALDAKQAPKTVNNFVALARFHFFDGLTFHRIVPGFVIQGGDPAGDGSGGPGYKFADELPKEGQYKIGSLAMANSGPDTNGSQFFVITGDQGVQLPAKYSLFGQLSAGLDVAKAIEAEGSPGDSSGKPQHTVTITSVTIKEA